MAGMSRSSQPRLPCNSGDRSPRYPLGRKCPTVHACDIPPRRATLLRAPHAALVRRTTPIRDRLHRHVRAVGRAQVSGGGADTGVAVALESANTGIAVLALAGLAALASGVVIALRRTARA